MEQTIEVGRISIFVANPIYGNVELSYGDSEILAKEFEDEFRDKFSKSPLQEFFTITSFEWKRGCIECFIEIAIYCAPFVANVAGGVIYTGSLIGGILGILKGFRYLYSKLTKRLHPIRIGKNELYSNEEIIKAIELLRSQEK